MAGIIIAPLTMTSYDVGIMLGLKGFCAAIIGGMSNGIGMIIGGLLLGVLESLGAGLVSASYQDAIASSSCWSFSLSGPRGYSIHPKRKGFNHFLRVPMTMTKGKKNLTTFYSLRLPS